MTAPTMTQVPGFRGDLIAPGDDRIVIELCEMCAVPVDPVERTARVQGGALWRDIDRATQAHGLATTGGSVGHTGVAGLTLGRGRQPRRRELRHNSRR